VAPRSVLRCLEGCAARIREGENILSPATNKALSTVETLLQQVHASDWEELLSRNKTGASKSALQAHSDRLLQSLLGLHTVICDSFLNHQVLIHHETKPSVTA
jgi:hypothetical protein